MKGWLVAGLATAALALPGMTAGAAQLSGAGGTAIFPVLSHWADTYAKETGDTLNYQPIGSGGGITQIKKRVLPFANSDKPLTPEDLDKNDLIQFPEVIISIVPVIHVGGVAAGELVLNGPALADVFLGKIRNWDDPPIKALNPNVALPHQAISVVHRSDGSGTTFNFTNYLSKVSPEWKDKVGEDTAVEWPMGIGGKGNAGVAAFVQNVDGAIGYVEYAYALENHLVYASMVNKAGKTVAPTKETFQAAAANADFSAVRSFYLILTDQPGDRSWPITAATYMLLRKDTDPARNAVLLKFLDWCLHHGRKEAEALNYVPLPDTVVEQIEASWTAQLKGPDGKPVWSAE